MTSKFSGKEFVFEYKNTKIVKSGKDNKHIHCRTDESIKRELKQSFLMAMKGSAGRKRFQFLRKQRHAIPEENDCTFDPGMVCFKIALFSVMGKWSILALVLKPFICIAIYFHRKRHTQTFIQKRIHRCLPLVHLIAVFLLYRLYSFQRLLLYTPMSWK